MAGIFNNFTRTRLNQIINGDSEMILESLTISQFTKTNLKEKMAFQFRHLSLLLSSGMETKKALEFLIVHCRLKKIKKILILLDQAIRSESHSGNESVNKIPFINPAVLHLLRTHKTGSKIPDFLNKIAEELEVSTTYQRKLMSALTYPILLLLITAVITAIILIFVIPVFTEMYQDFGSVLPAPTLIVIKISNMIISHIFYIGALVVFLFSTIIRFRSSMMVILSFLPFFSSLLKKISILQFIRHFAVLSSLDIPVKDSVTYAASAVENRYFSKKLKNMVPENHKSGDLAVAFADSGLFTDIDIQAVSVAQQTQSMDITFEYLSTYYEKQVNTKLTTLASNLDALFICLIGTIVGGIVISMYLPIFSLAGAIS